MTIVRAGWSVAAADRSPADFGVGSLTQAVTFVLPFWPRDNADQVRTRRARFGAMHDADNVGERRLNGPSGWPAFLPRPRRKPRPPPASRPNSNT